MDVESAVSQAEKLLPGRGPISDEADPRWRALLELRNHVQAEPEAIWEFVRRWGGAQDPTLRHALAVCLLQDLLARHFLVFFPRVEERVREEHRFAETFLRCAKWGQSALPAQSELFDKLTRFALKWCGADAGSLGAQV